MFRALLDTCVLFKPLLCDTLLCIAEEGLFQPLWSEDILDELRGSLLRYGIDKSSVDHRIGRMVEHFPAAMVTGHRTLIDAMTNDPKDRHILAAAVRGRADLIVTQNVRHFPPAATAPYDLEVIDQDAFLLDQQDLDPTAVRRARRSEDRAVNVHDVDLMHLRITRTGEHDVSLTALADVRAGATGTVPPHLRDGHYADSAQLGHAQGYRYPHDEPGGVLTQQYPPDELIGRDYYQPHGHGAEREIAERLPKLRRIIRGG